MSKIIAVDPGSSKSGLVSLTGASINWSEVLENDKVASRIGSEIVGGGWIVVIEDVKPYSMQISTAIIETCKFIGELKYRLQNEAGATVRMVGRSEVKKWVFDQFRDISVTMIREKLKRKGSVKEPHHFYVDDRIVKAAMKKHFGIELPKNGHSYEFGLKDHGWQALALATYVSSTLEK